MREKELDKEFIEGYKEVASGLTKMDFNCKDFKVKEIIEEMDMHLKQIQDLVDDMYPGVLP
jgi:hypothetical protein